MYFFYKFLKIKRPKRCICGTSKISHDIYTCDVCIEVHFQRAFNPNNQPTNQYNLKNTTQNTYV